MRSSSHTGCARMLSAVGMKVPIIEATCPSRVSRSTKQTLNGFPASREARAIVAASMIDVVDFPDPPLLEVTVIVV